ncbi:hypothetical protein [Bacteroides sp.]
MEKDKIIVKPEVNYFLAQLAVELVDAEYFSFFSNADQLVDDIFDFVYRIPEVAHFKLSAKCNKHFAKYGRNLEYAFFKRSSSKHTTWYVFFSRQKDLYIVHYITNNHKDGAYIR